MRFIGHRGAPAYAPENTLESFAVAAAHGLTEVELDVYNIEGRAVVIHDDTVDRTTNGRGAVQSYSIEALRRLNAGNGQQIPFLEEVIENLPESVGINVELKGENTAALIAKILTGYTRKGMDAGRFSISSFDHDELRTYGNLAVQAGLRTNVGVLYEGVPTGYELFLDNPLTRSVNIDYNDATPQLVERIHGDGLDVLAYTVNDADNVRRLGVMGVDGIFTNVPDLARAMVDKIEE